ncbi:hypothetical protein Pla175_45810 [Pirellulimonas nuda]|uniref:Chromosome partition protein Smc n=1 Tax=Pirellulimonas nuda TaxID=2528009 RepID=A0A518DI51_9BACT|nr:hypothetical protein [Pirellulimonas nuda]QDU91161.1 hypothetical protein Pla175_45810 [Pirellulimonas nuda]
MEKLIEQVSRAHRRLVTEQFLRRLVWRLFAALCVAAVAVAAPKMFVIEPLPTWWAQAWVGGAVALALALAAVETAVWRQSRLDAAQEIDRRFELRERVASCMSLSESDQETEAGAALVGDAARQIDRIEIGERFRVRLGRHAWAPLVPAALVFALMLVGNRAAEGGAAPSAKTIEAAQTKEAAKSLREKIAKKRAEAEKGDLKDATGLLKQVEKGVDELAKKEGAAKKDAMVKLNDLAKDLERRKAELGGRQALQDQLNSMKELGKGPGDKAAEAMRKGEWNKALDELKKMQDQLAKGEMSQEKQQELGKQLEKMQEKLAGAAEAHKKAMDDLKQEVEQQRAKGNLEQAAELQQKLEQLQQSAPQMQKMAEMAQQMADAAEALKQGDPQQAAEAMQQMAEQLKELGKQAAEMEMLAETMEQIEAAKNAMNCPGCQGAGCEQCMGGMMAGGQGMGEKPGMGMGEGQGAGPRPDEKNPTNFRDTRVRQTPGKGAATFGGMVEGPNIKGEVAEQVKQEMQAGEFAPADPVARERLNRSQKEHAEEYFRLMREGA